MKNPTPEELKAAACWFSVDQAPSEQMTAFKRTARYRQHQWARQQGVAEFGSHRGGSEQVRNGTKLTDADAAAGRNFLSSTIESVVEARLAASERHQTLDVRRLRRDLLSSMPMAFNLFGEASRRETSQLALLSVLAPDVAPETIEIVFEWSPGRGDEMYTRDRTAFDVAMKIGDEPVTVIGIETKYHEHSTRESPPSPAARRRHDEQTAFLVKVAEESGVFVEGWQDEVLGTDLRQIWRDHLLALSMRKHPDLWSANSRYVLLYPARNVSFSDASRRYGELLRQDETSFTCLTIEEVVDAAFAHNESLGAAFRDRYLW